MHKTKVRGVIKKDNKIFLVKIVNGDFFCLPGGTLDPDETFRECLTREIIEELNVKPIIGKCILVKEFMHNIRKELILDIWFEILNVDDFKNIDISKASHGFEISDEGFYSFEELKKINAKPDEIEKIIKSDLSVDLI